jgi:pimeloyl-ACP methyl ester carboxylesterase
LFDCSCYDDCQESIGLTLREVNSSGYNRNEFFKIGISIQIILFFKEMENNEMTMIQANGWSFDCEVTGEGSDIIFIHGEIHGSEYWEHQVKEFSKSHRCLTYNRRGHSSTGAPEYGYSLENQRRDLEALIEHFEIENPIIVAVAFGTTIAADYAIHYPNNVKGVVLVAWSELHDARKYFDRWVNANRLVVNILESEGKDGLVKFLRKEGGRTVYMVIPLASPVREACIQMFANHPIEEYKQGMLEFATSVPNLIEPFSKLDLPVLGVCGALDPFPDKPEILSRMAGFFEAPFIADASRFVHWEKPEEFNKLMHNYLQKIKE